MKKQGSFSFIGLTGLLETRKRLLNVFGRWREVDAQVSTLNFGDRFEWCGDWYTVIGIQAHRFSNRLLLIVTQERPLKPHVFEKDRVLSVRRKNEQDNAS